MCLECVRIIRFPTVTGWENSVLWNPRGQPRSLSFITVLGAPNFKLVCTCLSAHNTTSESIRDEKFGKISTASASTLVTYRAQMHQGQEFLTDTDLGPKEAFSWNVFANTQQFRLTKAVHFTNIFAVAEKNAQIKDSCKKTKRRDLNLKIQKKKQNLTHQLVWLPPPPP